jgi:hypothetical protein
MANPQPDPDDLWPACDEQPPGVSIRPLRHGDLQALLAHLDHPEHDDEDEGLVPGRPPGVGGPVVAVRVRASVGRPGASAQGEYRRLRAAERARWTHGLPWRAGAVLAVGVAAGLLGARLAPDLAGLLAVVAAAGLGWLLRFRPQRRHPGLAARGGRGAQHCPAACLPGAPWLGGAARLGHPRRPGQY